MLKFLTNFRYLSWIAIICSLLGSFLMFIIGFVKTYTAFSVFIVGMNPEDDNFHLSLGDIATTYLIKSLDAFLIALVLFIFAYGVFSLFVSNPTDESEYKVLKWIKNPSIAHLKNVLAELIVIILFVKFLEIAFIKLDKLDWDILVLPVSILLLAVALKFLDLRHTAEDQNDTKAPGVRS